MLPPVPGPLVSIVTPTLDQARYIERTIASVRGQTYSNVEHLIVDGGSTDGTLDILRREAVPGHLEWLSESDRGMYDAINKGVARTTGEIVAYLNSDDVYLPWAVESAVELFEAMPEVDIVFGDGIKVNAETGRQALRLFAPFDGATLAASGSLMQPTVFWRRRLVERMGGFDPELRYVADLDYWLRAAAAGAKIAHLDEVVAAELMHAERLSSAHRDAMAREEAEMRWRHRSGDEPLQATARALAREERWQRWLWLRFGLAFALRPLPGPWRRFIRAGKVSVRSQRLSDGLRPQAFRRLWGAASSGLAGEVLGVPAGQARARAASRRFLQRLRLLAITVPRLVPARVARGRRDPADWTSESGADAHGHGLVNQLLPDVVSRTGPGYLIEVGTTREKLPGQGSTVALAQLADRLGLAFITVDMDPANTAQARADLARYRSAQAVTAKGEDFLEQFEAPVVAAYLDAFDLQQGMHSPYRIDRYKRYLGTQITNDAASAMHLACAIALVPRLVGRGLVVIDDTWRVGDGFDGKGRDAVPALLQRGFRIVGETSQAIALQRDGSA